MGTIPSFGCPTKTKKNWLQTIAIIIFIMKKEDQFSTDFFIESDAAELIENITKRS